MDRRNFMKLAVATPLVMALPTVGVASIADIASTDPYVGKRGFSYMSVIVPTLQNNGLWPSPSFRMGNNVPTRYDINHNYAELLFLPRGGCVIPIYPIPLKLHYIAHQMVNIDAEKLLKSRNGSYMNLTWLNWIEE